MITSAREPFAWSDREPLLELDFPVSEFRHRISSLWKEADGAFDTLLVYGDAGDHSDLRYLTGIALWWGAAVALFTAGREPILVVGGVSHGEPMHSNIQTTWIRDVRLAAEANAVDLIAQVQQAEAGSIIAVPDLARRPQRLGEALMAKWPTVSLEPHTNVISRLRAIKSSAEIDVVRRLAELTSAGMNAAMDGAMAGATESEVAAAAHEACVAAGAERMLFGCFVASGPRSFLKNVTPRPDKAIAKGELVFIDLGCKLHGYQSDMSRNVVAGGASGELADMLTACLAAEETAIHLGKPGIAAADLVNAMSEVIKSRGFGEWDWSLCHGFGLDLVETPFFAASSQDILKEGMCFYVEPMIVRREMGSVCIEDMLLVTKDGVEQLTHSPKRRW